MKMLQGGLVTRLILFNKKAFLSMSVSYWSTHEQATESSFWSLAPLW